ncbi:ABC transporter permease [Chloroflexota bacterium]
MSHIVETWTQALDHILRDFLFVEQYAADWLRGLGTGTRVSVDRFYPEIGLAIKFGSPWSQPLVSEGCQRKALNDLCRQAGIALVEIDTELAGGEQALSEIRAALSTASRRVAQQRGALDTKRLMLPRIARARAECETLLSDVTRRRLRREASAASGREPGALGPSVTEPRAEALWAVLASLRAILKRVLLLAGVLLLVNAAAYMVAHSLRQRGPFHFNYVPDTTVDLAEVFAAYPEYLAGVLHGDLGTLYVGFSNSPSPILDLIVERLPRSLVLLGLAVIIAVVGGLAAGFMSVNQRTYRTNPLALILSLAGFSMPGFYLGIVVLYLIIWIAMHFGRGVFFLPTMGYGLDEHLVLPLLALAVRPTAEVARLTAEMLSEELPKDYVRVARGKGLSERAVLLRHAFRNVVALVIHALSNSWSYLLGSLVIIEKVFAWRGMGDALINAVTYGQSARSVFNPALVAALATSLALLYLLADQGTALLARILDPRLRHASGEPA